MLLQSLPLLLVLPAAEPLRDAHDDPLPPGAIARLGSMRFRHNAQIVAARFSADGKRLISANQRDGIRVWDRATGTMLQTAPYTAETAREFGLRSPENYNLVSPDGKIRAVKLEKMIRLVEAGTDKEVGRVPVPHQHYNALAFSPDSAVLAVIHRDRFVLFDVAHNDVRHAMRLTLPKEQPIPPSADIDFGFPQPLLAFAADGRTIATAYHDAGAVCVWDSDTGEEVRRLREDGEQCHALAFSSDGKSLAWIHEDGIAVADTTTGREMRSWPGEGRDHLQFAPDGRTLLTVSGNQLRLWDVTTGRDVLPVSAPRQFLEAPVFSPDGATIATREYRGVIRLWEARTGKQRRLLAHDEWSVQDRLAFSADGKTLAATASQRTKEASGVTIWDANTGRLLRVCRGEPGWQWGLALAPDGGTVAVLGKTGSVTVWNTATGEPKCRLPGTLIPGGKGDFSVGVQALAFAADGKTLIWAGNDNHVRTWDTTTGKRIDQAMVPPGRAAALGPTGRLLALAEDAHVTIIEARIGRELFRIDKADISRLVFSPDERMLAIGEWEKPLRLFEVATGLERARLDGVGGSPDFAFSPDSRLLATTMPDGTVLVWDLAGVVEMNRQR
jgi:WD40 repeat protein